MSTLLKDYLTPELLESAAKELKQVYPPFQPENFGPHVLNQNWQHLELKQRIRHIAVTLRDFLPDDYVQALSILVKYVEHLMNGETRQNSLFYLFLPDFIEKFGTDHYEASVKAIETVTKLISCEFAVRPLLLRYPERMMAQMLQWSYHPHDHVRRLASEGMRPRLPWGMAVPSLKKDPTPVLSVLENLKRDSSEFVRRSVANNLNDISKDHPAILCNILDSWKGISPETDKILKHASRTLLKKGDKTILKFFDLSHHGCLETSDFAVAESEVRSGEYLHFSFRIKNNSDTARTIRLEYAVYFLMSRNKYSKKVFKISERIYQPGETSHVMKRHSFRPITTRRYYQGIHRIAVVTNGCESESLEFQLILKEQG